MAEIDVCNKFVTFKIDDELYALDVFKSREILEVPDITKVPGMPDMIRGVINIRGEIVPVLDLKFIFGNQKTEFHQDTAIIITEMQDKEGVIQIGIIVDSAREVITIESDKIEPPPKIKAFIDNRYISGIGKVGKSFIIILNINRILSDMDIELLNEIE